MVRPRKQRWSRAKVPTSTLVEAMAAISRVPLDWMQANLRKSGGVYDRLVRVFYVSATPLDRKLLWTMYTNNRDGIRTAYLRCIHEITGILPSPVAHSTPKPKKPKDERCGYCLGHAEGGWVQCGHCPTWYHDFCVRVDLTHVANTDWLCPKCSDISVVSLPSRVLHSVSVRRMAADEISAMVGRDVSGKMYKTPSVLTSLIPVEAIQVDPAQVPSPPGSDVENVEMESDKDDCVSSNSLDDFQVHSTASVKRRRPPLDPLRLVGKRQLDPEHFLRSTHKKINLYL
ncbi:unnamed protein product [Allacma fusca]|uniref:PHD-type domain-containing protein n=1 Tax=Allacma fusca TaxID=39272 RepID=A0A8J2L3X6_9HEXA|nr:unnamed protein product [Allacma fusca]